MHALARESSDAGEEDVSVGVCPRGGPVIGDDGCFAHLSMSLRFLMTAAANWASSGVRLSRARFSRPEANAPAGRAAWPPRKWTPLQDGTACSKNLSTTSTAWSVASIFGSPPERLFREGAALSMLFALT